MTRHQVETQKACSPFCILHSGLLRSFLILLNRLSLLRRSEMRSKAKRNATTCSQPTPRASRALFYSLYNIDAHCAEAVRILHLHVEGLRVVPPDNCLGAFHQRQRILRETALSGDQLQRSAAPSWPRLINSITWPPEQKCLQPTRPGYLCLHVCDVRNGL